MQLENLCAAMKNASDARKVLHATTKTPGSQINKTTKNNLCKSQSSTDPQDDPSASMSLLLSNHKVAGAQGGRMESWLRSRDRQVPSSIGTRPSARTG